VSVISLGRKGTQFFARHFADQLTADFPTPDTVAGYTDIVAMSSVALDQFLNREYDEVIVAYNEFVSTLKQRPVVRTLLPISSAAREETSEVGEFAAGEGKTSGVSAVTDVIFEPDQDRVLEALLPRAVRSQLYQFLLDANASEHAARMLAMKNATDNADELIDDLTLTMNGLRQAGITQEISEISAGAEALRRS
jgi:F-type H+-transporting ATPase subunit gamma